ncbi:MULTISPECIES: LPXTG cell wall anchor domain-containing protein [unclassified Streptomyces]|uniref:LPXTG cell wall anchor domain-containing protein n=1 Tax=unclassified Streptomyces TaxID=2593676 RepID=UPI0036E40971
MPMPPRHRRASRTAAGVLGAACLIALAAAPAAFGDEPGPELVAGGIQAIDGVKPGGAFEMRATVANKGVATAEKVWVSYSVTRGLDFAAVPSNCLVQHIPSYDEMPERWTAACAFDQAVEPGAVYTTDKPVDVKVLDRALNEEIRVRVEAVQPAPDDNGTEPVAGTAPALKLVQAPAGDAGSRSVVDMPVTAVNTADYQVTGDALKGRVGDTVTMKATFTNAGPAWVWPREGDKAVSVRITPPAGTSVVKRGQFCQARGAEYVCGMRSLHEGSGETYTFHLKIEKRVPDATGSVALSSEARPFDPNKENDRADITLDVTGGTPTGPTSSPTSGPTSSPTSSPTGDPSSSAGGSSSIGGGGVTPDGGHLAETGSSTLPIGAAAGAALVAGAGTLIIVRRRREQGTN